MSAGGAPFCAAALPIVARRPSRASPATLPLASEGKSNRPAAMKTPRSADSGQAGRRDALGEGLAHAKVPSPKGLFRA